MNPDCTCHVTTLGGYVRWDSDPACPVHRGAADVIRGAIEVSRVAETVGPPPEALRQVQPSTGWTARSFQPAPTPEVGPPPPPAPSVAERGVDVAGLWRDIHAGRGHAWKLESCGVCHDSAVRTVDILRIAAKGHAMRESS